MNIRQMANAFEATKVGLRHTKDGIFLTLSLHPQEVPQDIFSDLIGTRYMVAMVKVNDQGEPEPGQKNREGHQALSISQTLPRNRKFQIWASKRFHVDPTEEGAADAIRERCVIESRKELLTDERARKILFGIRDEFEEWLSRGGQ